MDVTKINYLKILVTKISRLFTTLVNIFADIITIIIFKKY